MNFLKTMLLLTGLTALFMFIGGMLGGQSGMTAAFIFACFMNLGAYWFSDKLVLAMYRGRLISRDESPRLYSMIEQLSASAGLPMPKVYIIPSRSPNAFATGRNPSHAAVAVTEGLLDLLDDNEIFGVLAHEMAHIRHHDILIASIAATLAGAIGLLADMSRWALIFGGTYQRDNRRAHPAALILTALFAPLAALLIQTAVSRSREYAADEAGARLCGNPLYLANALRRLEFGTAQIPMREANPGTAHLFIVSPLAAEGFVNLFNTHPPLRDRITRLEQMRF